MAVSSSRSSGPGSAMAPVIAATIAVADASIGSLSSDICGSEIQDRLDFERGEPRMLAADQRAHAGDVRRCETVAGVARRRPTQTRHRHRLAAREELHRWVWVIQHEMRVVLGVAAH